LLAVIDAARLIFISFHMLLPFSFSPFELLCRRCRAAAKRRRMPRCLLAARCQRAISLRLIFSPLISPISLAASSRIADFLRY